MPCRDETQLEFDQNVKGCSEKGGKRVVMKWVPTATVLEVLQNRPTTDHTPMVVGYDTGPDESVKTTAAGRGRQESDAFHAKCGLQGCRQHGCGFELTRAHGLGSCASSQ